MGTEAAQSRRILGCSLLQCDELCRICWSGRRLSDSSCLILPQVLPAPGPASHALPQPLPQQQQGYHPPQVQYQQPPVQHQQQPHLQHQQQPGLQPLYQQPSQPQYMVQQQPQQLQPQGRMRPPGPERGLLGPPPAAAAPTPVTLQPPAAAPVTLLPPAAATAWVPGQPAAARGSLSSQASRPNLQENGRVQVDCISLECVHILA
jgi:hypothetical protein